VHPAAKKLPKPKEETEQMAPKTCKEQVAAKLADWLKVASQARTHSITLSSLEFAEELGKKLLSHASAMEKAYLRINETLKNKKSKEGDFKLILESMDEKLKTSEKLQAQHAVMHHVAPSKYYHTKSELQQLQVYTLTF